MAHIFFNRTTAVMVTGSAVSLSLLLSPTVSSAQPTPAAAGTPAAGQHAPARVDGSLSYAWHGFGLTPKKAKKPKIYFKYSNVLHKPSEKARAGKVYVEFWDPKTGLKDRIVRISRSTARLQLTRWRKTKYQGRSVVRPTRATLKYRDRWNGRWHSNSFRDGNMDRIWSGNLTWASLTGDRRKVRIPPDISGSGIRLAVRGWDLAARAKTRPSWYFKLNRPISRPTTSYLSGSIYSYHRVKGQLPRRYKYTSNARIRLTDWKYVRQGRNRGFWLPSRASVTESGRTCRFRDSNRDGVWKSNLQWDGPSCGNRRMS